MPSKGTWLSIAMATALGLPMIWLVGVSSLFLAWIVFGDNDPPWWTMGRAGEVVVTSLSIGAGMIAWLTVWWMTRGLRRPPS